MWKKINVKLKFLRLKFHHLLSQRLFFFSSSSSLLQPLLLLLPLFFSPPSHASSSSSILLLRTCILQSGLQIWYFFLHFWFFIFIVIFVLFLLWNSKSLRLKFHVTKTSPCQQSKLESLWLNFFAELEPQRLEMLFSSILSSSC